KATANTAAMSVPGTLGQYVSKSGGNAFHSTLYTDYENDSLEATNIDAAQIAAGVQGGPGLAATDTNRLQHLSDFNVDVGGYLQKDRLWFYVAYRYTTVGQRYHWLLDEVSRQTAPVETLKLTFNLTSTQRAIGYVQHENVDQADYFNAGSSQPVQLANAL